jgi:hypothetical protein
MREIAETDEAMPVEVTETDGPIATAREAKERCTGELLTEERLNE